MKKISLLILMSLITVNSYSNYLDDNLKNENWNGIDVVWLEDNSLPTYDISIYFKEGALGDGDKFGVTQFKFDQLSSGTSKYSQTQILEQLEYYGAGINTNVTHEFSDVTVSGLVKDMKPTLKMICHVFNQAQFPEKQFSTYKTRFKNSMKSIVTNHSSLANLVFRQASLQGSGYEFPVKGTMKTVDIITREDLISRLSHFNNKVQKRIYIKGPSGVKAAKEIFAKECKWKKTDYSLSLKNVKDSPANDEILFVPVPKANQAQVRVGRVLTSSEVAKTDHDLDSFSNNYVGGGFTSLLMQELRKAKGLTYSVGSYISAQKTYGRSGLSTFTKNETIVEMLNSIKDILDNKSQKMTDSDLVVLRRKIKGNYLLSLESTSNFVKNLQYFDHIGRNYKEIYEFSENVDSFSIENVKSTLKRVFKWDKQIKLVLGNKSLIKELQKAGYKVKVIDYKDYL